MLTKSRLIQIACMLLILVGLFVWRTANFSDSINIEADALTHSSAQANADTLCELSEPCVFHTSIGDFTLAVDGGAIIPEQWFHLNLTSETENWTVTEAKIVGKTMFMGKIPVKFLPVQKIGTHLQATAVSMLGVCTEEQMIWRLDIVIEANGLPVSLHYDFLIEK
jgi:hypothetical protein